MAKLLRAPVGAACALFATALFAAAQTPAIAPPGMLNYMEGQVTLNGKTLGSRSAGNTELAPGQVLQTTNGRAEILLTPGAFLRVGENSAVRMVSASITDTRLDLLNGEAMVEVAEIEKENRIDVVGNGVTTRLEKKGLYEFTTAPAIVKVYDGKAQVWSDDHKTDAGKGEQVPLLPNAALKAQKFDRKNTDQLYAWSKLRSRYMAEANQSSAETIIATGPSWYGGTGWYWNSYYDTWAFVPGAGLLYSPFGFGYYSPAYFGYYYPPYYRLYYHHPFGNPHQGFGHSTGTMAGAPPAAGGSGVQFGSPGMAAPPSAPMAAPAPRAPVAPAPAPSAPAAGGSGVVFGHGR